MNTIINFLFYFVVLFVIIYGVILYQRWKRKNMMIYNPFALWVMFSRCECQECKCEFDKAFERFEYAYQKIKCPCPKCGVDTNCIILGSFHIRIETPREKKWKKFEERFR